MAKPKVTTPPVTTKVRLCTANVRKVAEIEVCNFKLKSHWSGIGDVCPNKDNHLYPMLTGFCHSGWHEGIKPTTASGTPAPSCKAYLNCPCKCHADLNRMFDMVGKERVLVDKSEWRPNNPYVLPSIGDVIAASSFSPSGVTPAVAIESPAPEIVPVAIQHTFTPTPTGRAGRGELESWVREITDIWAVDQEGLCTPRFVSEYIGRRRGIAPPSVGAVDAVFNRWAAIGFAKIERKPSRFEGYTEEGIRHGLEGMRARWRRAAAAANK